MRLGEDFGGRSDKFGNEFERRWVIAQAMRLLSEGALSLLWEPIGVEGQGIDVSVTTRDGTREVHQCKVKNRSEGKWTAGDLNSEAVFTRPIKGAGLFSRPLFAKFGHRNPTQADRGDSQIRL